MASSRPPEGPACPRCGRPTHGRRAAPVERSDPAGEVVARLEGVAVWQCGAGHATVVDEAPAARVRRAVHAQLVMARRRRLRRDDACGACGAVLTMPARRTETPVVDDTGPSVVTLSPTLPMVRCPTCSTEQVPPDAAAALDRLVDDLVDDIASPEP